MSSSFIPAPSFCFIAPTSFLHPLQQYLTSTHLVLGHLVDRDEEYASFYKQRQIAGDFIIMDNSAYELKVPYAPERLIELGYKCGASAIVLPDYPFEPALRTVEAAEEFAPMFHDHGFECMFVPQSRRGDLDDWIWAYEWARDNDDIGIIGYSILGIPNALPHIAPAFARVVMAQMLMSKGIYATDKHSHYLGLNAGPALEIPSLLRMGALDTCDSSGPVWAAVHGHAYTEDADSYQSTRKLITPVDFNMRMPRDAPTVQRIKRNMHMTQSLFTRVQATTDWYADHGE